MKPTNPRIAIRNIGLGAAAAPVVVALVVRWATGAAPSTAGAAAEFSEESMNQPAPLPKLTVPQQFALAFATSALEQPITSSPMLPVNMGGDSSQDPQADDDEAANPASAPAKGTGRSTLPPVPTFVATSVMVSVRHSLATINGKLRRIGDEIEPGWRLKSIDVAKGLILITSKDGRQVQVPIRKSGR